MSYWCPFCSKVLIFSSENYGTYSCDAPCRRSWGENYVNEHKDDFKSASRNPLS